MNSFAQDYEESCKNDLPDSCWNCDAGGTMICCELCPASCCQTCLSLSSTPPLRRELVLYQLPVFESVEVFFKRRAVKESAECPRGEWKLRQNNADF